MSQKFTYCFEELELVKGLSVFAYGEAEISYRVCPAEPDVGIFHRYASDIEVESIFVQDSKGKELIRIDYRHWLYPLVSEALLDGDRLEHACMEDYTSE